MNDATEQMDGAPESRVVEGAGVVVISQNSDLGSRIEKAMSDAILKAMDEGVTDPDEQRARMMAARDEAMKD